VQVIDGERQKVLTGTCFRTYGNQAGGANAAMVGLYNPTGSGKTIYVIAMRVGLNAADVYTIGRTTSQLSTGGGILTTQASGINLAAGLLTGAGLVCAGNPAGGIAALAGYQGLLQGYVAASTDAIVVMPPRATRARIRRDSNSEHRGHHQPGQFRVGGMATMNPLFIAAGLAAFLLLQILAHNRAQATTDQAAADQAADADNLWQSVDLLGLAGAAIEARGIDGALSGDDQAAANVAAFMATISKAEGTDKGADPYRVCYGYRHTVQDLAEHPAVKTSTHPVEWAGEPLDKLGPSYTGQVSTAAGRYQIKRATWLECKAGAALPDFGPDSQDRAAVFLLKRRGALDDVRAGRFAAAVNRCRQEWASLPGAGYAGQGERSMADLQTAFINNGGALA
jgi:lysozyme